MQTFSDRLPLCRCFCEDRPALRSPEANPASCETALRESDSSLALRPDVPCLQRWIDLNA